MRRAHSPSDGRATRPGGREARRLGALWGALLLAIGCGTIPFQAPPFDKEPAARMPLPKSESPLQPVKFVVDSSPATNLFHWIDNLAESSYGKNRLTYLRDWTQRFGPLTGEERALLAEFRQIRTRRIPYQPHGGVEFVGDCLPQVEPPFTRRQSMTIAALQSQTVDQLVQRLGELVEPEEAKRLELIVRRFSERFEWLWAESKFLEPFRDQFERFLNEPKNQELLGLFARFYGAKLDPEIPSYVHLVAVLQQDVGTHAEANGNHLLLEIRPHEVPTTQIEVIFHEFCHDLYRRLSPERRLQLAAQFYRSGSSGLTAWTLLQEALPTAMGQGVATAILNPDFVFPRAWYHIPEIDLAAHHIYPVVRSAFFAGEVLDDRLVAKLVSRIDRSRLDDRVPPLDQLNEGMVLIADQDRSSRLAQLLAVRPGRLLFEFDPTTNGGIEFSRRSSCLPLIAILALEDLPRWPIAGDEKVEIPRGYLPLPRSAHGLIVPLTRPSGAAALWVLARTRQDLPLALEALAKLRGWPREPVPIRR